MDLRVARVHQLGDQIGKDDGGADADDDVVVVAHW